MNAYDQMFDRTLEMVKEHEILIASAIKKLEQAVAHYPPLASPANHRPRTSAPRHHTEEEPMTETSHMLGPFDDQGARLMDLNDLVLAQGETLQHIIETLNQLDLPDIEPPGEE